MRDHLRRARVEHNWPCKMATKAEDAAGEVEVEAKELPAAEDEKPDETKKAEAGEAEDDDEDEEDVYKVEAILDMEKRRGKAYFLVKWEGYDDEADNTWEPEAHLTTCPNLMQEFLSKRAAEQAAVKAAASSGAGGTATAAAKRRREEIFGDDDDDDESDPDDDEYVEDSEDGDEEEGEDDDDDEDDEPRPSKSKAKAKETAPPPAKRPKQATTSDKLKPSELAALRTKIQACDASKLGSVLATLLNDYPSLVPDAVKLMDASDEE